MFGDYDDFFGNGASGGGASKIKLLVQLDKNSAINASLSFSHSEISSKRIVTSRIKEALKLRRCDVEDIRLFNKQGLELFEQDLPYLQDGTQLFVSQGEDFDISCYYSQYEIVSKLGAGGFGSVYLGQHKGDGTKVAIKITNADTMNTVKDLELVFAEAETLKNIKHQNIVKIYSSYLIKKTLQAYFIMEYLEGGELLDYIVNKESLSEEEALVVFKQLISAIDYLHSRKIIHRDLKLENILRVSHTSDQFKIVDFGISGLCAGRQSQETNAGSLNYMAPEVFMRKNVGASPSLDIWALGCILYAMIYGKIPFSEKKESDLKKKITTGSVNYLNSKRLSPELRDLFNKLFVVEPEERINVYEITQHPWFRGKKFTENSKTPGFGLQKIGEIIDESEEESPSKTIKGRKVQFDTQKAPRKKVRRMTKKKKKKVGSPFSNGSKGSGSKQQQGYLPFKWGG